MTRNNLRDQLSWLLRDISITLPAGPSLPSAPDSFGSQSEPSQASATRSQPQASAVPALSPTDPTPTARSTAVPSGPPSVADAVQPPRRLDTVAAEGGMARLTSAAKSKKPSLMVKEQPLPTPDSTSSIPPLQRAFSQLVDRKNARSTKKEPPATPAPASTAAVRSPVFTSDIFSGVDSIDLTSDDTPIKSSPHRDVRLWTEDCASRPEPLPRKSGKKRKSVEMSKVTPTPKKKQLVVDDDDDEFPDVHTLTELGSTRPKRGLSKGLPSSQNTPIKARVAAASSYETSVIEEHTVTETVSRTKTRVRRADSVAALAEGSAVPATAPIAAPLGNEASPRRPSTRGAVEDTSAGEPRSTPGPSRKKSRKPRDSAVIQDSEDEFLTPQTEHISFFSCVSGSQSDREGEESTQRANDSTGHVAEGRSPRSETPSRKRQREISPAPHVDNAEPEKPVAHSSDSDGSTLIMDLFLRNPGVIRRKRQEIQTEMKKLSADYMRALSDNWPRDRKEQVKENRKRLSEQQKTLDALGAEYDAHKALKERKDTLVQKLVEKFENGLVASEDEDAADEMSHQIQEKEQNLRHLLVAAGMNNLELFEDAGEAAEPSSAPHHVVFGTQSPPHSVVSQMTRQASMSTSTIADNAPQVIRQTQVPTKGPPVLSRMDKYGDSILAPQPPPFPREAMPQNRVPVSRTPAIQSAATGAAFSDGLLDDDDDHGDMMELCDNPPLPRRPQPQPPKPPVRAAAGSRSASRWAGEEVNYFSDDEDSMVQFAESLERESSSRPSLSTQASRSALLETSGNTRIVPRSRTEPPRRDKKSDSAPKPSISRDLMKHAWSNDVRRALKDHFRMSGFRHNQLEAINATLSGKDAFVLMPTGGGKSLCYQLPAVIDTGNTRGVTIVVSPLLSLMQDQIDHLKALHILARQFSGDVDKAQRDMILDALRSSKNPENMVRLLYVTPEMIGKSQAFLNALDKVYSNDKLARIVIDEAHCVSQWGHDFRPDYKTLGEVRRRYPKVPVMALTATATPHVIVDIKLNLSIPQCEIFSQSFNRPNLFYDIRTKGKNIVQTIADLIQSDHEGETGIVYTLSRKSAETIAKKLRDQSGISAHHYHAKMETEEKTDVQRKWQSGQIKVVVATIAFGMGIDKPDVRFVVHHTLPKSLEGYYQETGRAGRDGGQSHCYLYFGYGDITSLRKMINDGEGNQEQRDRQSQMLNRVIDFCEDKRECRRQSILRYFGEKFDPASCNKTCDNCRNGGHFELVDHTETAVAALQVIQARRQTTPKQCADVLLGRNNPKDHERPEQYGAAKPLKEHVVLNILYRLTAEEALEEVNKPIKGGMVATYCHIGPRAHEFLSGARKLELVTKVGRGAGDQDADGLPKKRTKKSATGEQSRLPPSTNVSSPVLNSRKKNGGRAQLQVEDDEESDAAPAGSIHANGYAKDGFVISSEADDDDEYFEPMRAPTKGRQRTLDEMRGPVQGSRGGEAEIDEIHGDFVEQFVQDAKLAEERIRNTNSLRKALFTEQQLRIMATTWTTTLSKMYQISGISQENVKKYGGHLLPILLKYYNLYRNAMGTNGAGADDDVVDLVSDGDEDRHGHGGPGCHQRKQPAAAAQARRSTAKGKKPAQENFFSDEAEEDDDQEDSFEQSRYFGSGGGGQGGAETAAEREAREWNERFDQAGEAAGARPKSRSRNGAGSGTGGRSSGGWKGGKKSYARRSSGGGVAKRKTFGKKAAAASKSGAAGSSARAKASGSGGGFGLMPL
ncbi:hypothetical protein RB597_004482 [Gaeumannomyces tritici]